MKRLLRIALTFLILITCCTATIAQDFTTYRGPSNPYYWKNRKPDAAYWQQDVHYTINAKIDETAHTITATEELEYINNSPDTLTYVYFHLYQNAFVKGSHLHALEEAQGIKAKLGKYEAAGLGITIENLQAGGQPLRTELDNTILKVYLPKPLYPNSSTTFSMDFKTYWDNGSTRRRMKMYPAWGFMHYNGVQWFPKVCVYDRKLGWDTDQHMNKEFYGDFGVYDVSLDFASNYILEATGELQNRAQVLPDTLRQKLDVKNFASKRWNEAPSTIIPYNKDERKIWKYHAENVHDFAFTADPSFRIATVYSNGVECVGIVQEPHAAAWQNSAQLVAKVIETFSTDIGPYAYPKMVAADAADGTEYPMLTLDNGGDPGYRGLLVHEIGHNWFYGMVGSNETYRAPLDEGFTQFLTVWGLNRIDGKYLKEGVPKSKYRRKFYEPKEARDNRAYAPYLYSVIQGDDHTLNTHSNDFNNALGHEGGYGLVYYKTAVMLYNLQYVLGDSLFNAAFSHYFNQWKMAHPYFEDFRASIIQFTKVDLNWFFDEWLETTKSIDYGIDYAKKVRGTDSFDVHLRRRGDMQMPIDFTVTGKDGTKQDYHIPNTWFAKSTNATTLPKWYGWGKLHDTYTARISAPSGLKYVQIDTSERLADIYPANNTYAHGFFNHNPFYLTKFDGGLNNPLDRHHYRTYIRPDIWYNPIDGIKAGIHLEGDYMRTMHRMDAAIWWNSHFLQSRPYQSFQSQGWYDRYDPVNFTFSYASPISIHYLKHEVEFNIRYLDGLRTGRFGYNWKPNAAFNLRGYLQFMNRGDEANNLDYLLYRNEWSSTYKRPNNSLNLELTRSYKWRRTATISVLSLRAPIFTGNEANAFNYSYIQLDHKTTFGIGKLELRTRLFGRAGTGSSIPYESALWVAGANPEELMENKYTRSIGFVPDEWRGISRYETNHFQQGGGLNLRGYAGYFVADEKDGNLYIGYKGRSGASVNIEADIDNYIPLQPRITRNWLHMDVYGFFDGGIMELSRINSLADYQNSTPTEEWSDVRVDAGVGFALTIKQWGVFEKAKPLTLRFDIPLFLNRPPYANPQYTTFRYVVGINRSF